MNVFFDSEFSTLDEKGIRRLISIGCVAQNGQEFYSETDTWNEGLCSDFVIKNVLPLLNGGECRMTEAQLAVRLKEWIEGLTDQQVILRSDCPGVDWPWIEQLFTFYGFWPKNLRPKCGTIYFEEHRQHHRYLAGLQSFWKDNIAKQHHALIDARSLAFAWRFAIRRGL